MTADLSYYLALGTISKTTLLGTASNNLQNFPNQSDQVMPSLTWFYTNPERDVSDRPALMRRSVMGDVSIRDDGFYAFQWGFRAWTFGQLSYWLTTFHGGPNVYANPGSTAVTVQTFMDTDYVCFHAQMYRLKWKDDYKAEDGGVREVVIKFVAPPDGIVSS